MSRTPSFGFSPTTNMSPPVLEHLTKDFLQSTRRGGVDFHNLKLPARRGKLPLHSQLWRRYDLYLLLSFALFMVLMFYLRNRDLSVDSLNLSDENAFIILRNSLTLLFLYALRQPLLRRFFYFLEHAEQQIQIERMPDRIILIRHGESQGNVDVTAYSHIPDNRMPLSQKGRKQAHAAGRSLRQYIGHDETVRFFLSPYKRTRETFEHIMESWGLSNTMYSVREDSRLREQDFGNFQDPEDVKEQMQQRKLFGSFYYRFKGGEAGSDVDCKDNFILVTHGVVWRMLLMRYFKWTVAEYHSLWNPENCQMAILQKGKDGRYALLTPLRRNPSTQEMSKSL